MFGTSYHASSEIVVDGVIRPWWQVQQVTRCTPAKFVRLMPATISTMRRVVTLRGVSITKSALSVPALGWQSAQSRPRLAEIRPMLAMKSSTLSSLSVLVVTFLKASPAFLPAAGVGAWLAATTSPLAHAAVITAIARLNRHHVPVISLSLSRRSRVDADAL